MLDSLNIWVDIVGMVLALGVAAFVVVHFLLSVLTGRIKKQFVEDYWDSLAHRMHDPETYGYKKPLGWQFPVPVRVWHWINIVSFLILLISGLYIRYPFFGGGRETMRLLHYIFMYIITANLAFRIAYLFIDRASLKDYFYFDRQDLKVIPMVIKYYTFLGPPYPHFKKFNPLQRPTYPMIWALLTLQAITGFLIWRPTLAGPLAGIIGGPADLAAWMRLIHQINMRLMVAIGTVHSYLGIVVDYPAVKVFWFWQEPDLTKYEHEEHGHGSHDAEHAAHSETGPLHTGEAMQAEGDQAGEMHTATAGEQGEDSKQGSPTALNDDGQIAPAH